MPNPRNQRASNHRRVPMELRHLLEAQGPQLPLETGNTDLGNKWPPLETHVLPRAAHRFSPDTSMLRGRCDCLFPAVPGQLRVCFLPALHPAPHGKPLCRKLSSSPRDTLHLDEGLHRWVLLTLQTEPFQVQRERGFCACCRKAGLSSFCLAFCLITPLAAIIFPSFCSFFLNIEYLKTATSNRREGYEEPGTAFHPA